MVDIWLLGNIVVVHVLTSLNFHNNFTHFPRNLSTTTKNILHIEISETKTTGRQFLRILISHILSLNSKKKDSIYRPRSRLCFYCNKIVKYSDFFLQKCYSCSDASSREVFAMDIRVVGHYETDVKNRTVNAIPRETRYYWYGNQKHAV